MSTFTSIASPTESVYKEKGSKFLAFAYPAENVEDINKYLQDLRKNHPKAVHVCYAYRLGAALDIFKANDDGEPSNSAGMPILNQIKSAGLTNILVAVVRYFGGTKLGVPGLINAYKTVAADALKNAIFVEYFEKEELSLRTSYERINDLQNFLKKRNVAVIRQEFAENCTLRVSFPTEMASELKKELSELYFIEVP